MHQVIERDEPNVKQARIKGISTFDTCFFDWKKQINS